jgi:hypothetical protein
MIYGKYTEWPYTDADRRPCSPAQNETMTAQGQSFRGQYLLPLLTSADAVALVQKAFRLLCGGQPSELGAEGMLCG